MYNKKQILKVSYPIFLGLLAQNIINVTDTAFLGHVGEVELGASAIGGLYYLCFFILAFGFSIGAQILMARRNGEKKYTQIGPILTQGSLFSFIIAIVLLFISLKTARPMMKLMLSSDEITAAAETFFDWRVWGLVFSFINTMYRGFYIAITRTKVLTLNAIVMAIINIFLDWVLIFGKLGLPAMGLEGAALASVIAEAGSLIFFIIYTKITVDGEKYNLHFKLRLDRRIIVSILNVSVFLMLQQFVPFATWFIFFLALERLGQRELAVANIVRSIYIIALIPINAFQTTVNTLVSNAMGAGNVDHVGSIIKRISKMSLATAIFCAVIMIAIPKILLSIYTNDTFLVEEAISSLQVISIALVICSVANILFGGISGTGNARAALYIELLCQVAYISYIFITAWWLKWSVAGCFSCEILLSIFILIISHLYLKYGQWKQVKI